MGNFIDIADKRFGSWLVIQRVETQHSGKARWLCWCDCGGTGVIESTQLIHGVSKSCGCERHHMPATEMTGKRIDRWVVIERAHNKLGDNAMWLCECDCGIQRVVSGNSLRMGGTKSCGCIKAMKSRGLDDRRCVAYKEWKRSIRERDNYTCQMPECDHTGEWGDGTLHTHHILSWAKYPELRYDVDNGITYCKWCHIKVHKNKDQL